MQAVVATYMGEFDMNLIFFLILVILVLLACVVYLYHKRNRLSDHWQDSYFILRSTHDGVKSDIKKMINGCSRQFPNATLTLKFDNDDPYIHVKKGEVTRKVTLTDIQNIKIARRVSKLKELM